MAGHKEKIIRITLEIVGSVERIKFIVSIEKRDQDGGTFIKQAKHVLFPYNIDFTKMIIAACFLIMETIQLITKYIPFSRTET